MKVLFITNVPSPYRVSFFNELGKYCELTVLFEKTNSKERDKSWKKYQFDNFKGVFLKGIEFRVDMSVCFEVIHYIKQDNYDIVVCSDFTSPTGIIAIEYMRRHNIPYYLESDGGFPKTGTGVKEKIKHYIIPKAKGYFCTGDMHKQYYLTYGAEKERIINYPFSSIKQSQIIEEPVADEEKRKLREKLSIKEEKMILAVGQFIHRKGFDVLLESVKQLDENVGVYFVGGEPTEEYLKTKEKYGLSHVRFVGFKRPQELEEFYLAADVFVLPTREDIWGLVINEAMAYGLPIITTNRCLAGVEMIIPEENGYLVNVDKSDELRQALERLLHNQQLCKQMSMNNLKKARKYTIEKMADRHMEIFEIDERKTNEKNNF